MPSQELASSPGGLDGASRGSLKRHKTLPHPRREISTETYSAPPSTVTRDVPVDTNSTSPSASYNSSPRTLKHTSKRIGLPDLPPTPPAHSRQSSNDRSIPGQYLSNGEAGESPTPNTPPNVHSPPTPDFTPPRNPRRLLVMRPPPTDRIPSSRAESFKTARENPSSSDELLTVSIQAPRPPVRDAGRAPELRLHNLGLGLELDFDRPRTPTPVLRQKFSFEDDEFRRFDGEWDAKGADNGGLGPEWDSNLMRNVTVRKRTKRKPYILVDKGSSRALLDEYVVPANATELLREYGVEDGAVNRGRVDRSGTTRDRSARRQSGPGQMAVAEGPSTPDVWRFSTMSMPNSEVIEAVVVVNSTPSRRKTLRHMKKQYALRDFSAEHSATAPLATNAVSDVSRRPSNKTKIPDRQHLRVRTNASTQTSASTRSRRRILADGHIPVIVVPERRSSSKPARPPSLRSTSSRHSKKTASLRSAPLSQSAGSNIPGAISQPTIRQRRLSDSAASSSGTPPTIPTRRSSLSAPTSRHTSAATSRAGSLTAESLRAHNVTQALEAAAAAANPVVPFAPPADPATHRLTALTVDTTRDALFGQRLSAQVTPFSLFSQASCETHMTALEIAEAQAVALFPHQNTSVLMVEHSAFGSGGGELPALRAAEPATPIQPPPPTNDDEQQLLPLVVDSPLRNPRPAPVPAFHPPLINFIPPTPAAHTPAGDEDKQLGHNLAPRPATANDASGPPRSLSLLRRALANRRRRHSVDPVGWVSGAGADAPRSRFSLRRRREVDEAEADAAAEYPTVTDQSPDESRLHPFWRPARFWDDLEGEEGEGYEDERYREGEEGYREEEEGWVGGLRRTFAILPAGSYGGRRTGRMVGRRRSVGDVWGVKISWVGMAGLAGLRKRVGEGWGERRRERRREGLRRSISAPWGARDGVEEVLRGRGGMGGGV